jgi:hypothetical protein
MAKRRSHFWPGFIIGLLAALLIVAVLILFVPRFRPLLGLDDAIEQKENVPVPAVPQPSANTTIDSSPETEVPEETVSSENITVTSPAPGEKVTSPMIVRGRARVFENLVNIRLRAADGEVITETFASANAPDVGQFGDFEISVNFTQPTQDSGTLEVFSQSPKDGSEINKVTIPVSF